MTHQRTALFCLIFTASLLFGCRFFSGAPTETAKPAAVVKTLYNYNGDLAPESDAAFCTLIGTLKDCLAPSTKLYRVSFKDVTVSGRPFSNPNMFGQKCSCLNASPIQQGRFDFEGEKVMVFDLKEPTLRLNGHLLDDSLIDALTEQITNNNLILAI